MTYLLYLIFTPFKESIRVNLSLLYQRVCVELVIKPYLGPFIHFGIILLLIYIFNYNVVYAMEREDLRDIQFAFSGSEAQKCEYLDRLRQIRDPNRILAIQEYLRAYAAENNINLDHLQIVDGNITVANIGNTYTEHKQSNESWRSAFRAGALFVIITGVGYLIFRNWESIRDLVFDIGSHATEHFSLDHLHLIRTATFLFQDPQHANQIMLGLSNLGFIGLGNHPEA